MAIEPKPQLTAVAHGRTVTISDGKHTVKTDCESPAVAKKLAKRLLATPSMGSCTMASVGVDGPRRHQSVPE